MTHPQLEKSAALPQQKSGEKYQKPVIQEKTEATLQTIQNRLRKKSQRSIRAFGEQVPFTIHRSTNLRKMLPRIAENNSQNVNKTCYSDGQL